MFNQILLYLLKLVIEHLIQSALREYSLVDQLNLVIIEMMK